MAATRFILAPLGGVFVATSLLYTFRHTIAVRTHDTAVTLNKIKLQLNDIDPDNWDKEGKERVTREQLRPAYVAPVRPSVTEEIKSRWNVSALARSIRLCPHAKSRRLTRFLPFSSIVAPFPHRRSTSLAPSTPSQTPTTTIFSPTVSSPQRTSYPASHPRNPHQRSEHLSQHKPLLPVASRPASSTRRVSRCEKRATPCRKPGMLFVDQAAVLALVSRGLLGWMRVRWRRWWKARLGQGWERSGKDRQGTRIISERVRVCAELVVLSGSDGHDQRRPAHSVI